MKIKNFYQKTCKKSTLEIQDFETLPFRAQEWVVLTRHQAFNFVTLMYRYNS